MHFSYSVTAYIEGSNQVTKPNPPGTMRKKPSNQVITERETMAVRLSVWYAGKLPLPLLYSLCYPGAFEDAQALRDLNAVASRWWRSKKIQECLSTETATFKAYRDAEESRIKAECEARQQAVRKDDAPAIDYSDPSQQRRKLNELIAGSTDPHDQLDALKALMARPEIAPDSRKEKPVRVYVPLSCHECPLYKDAKAKRNVK